VIILYILYLSDSLPTYLITTWLLILKQ
jgi:hypothetical protein